MKKLCCFVTSLIFFSVSLAQGTAAALVIPKEPSSQAAGMSAERLKRIDLLLKQSIDSGWMNGAVALVIRNGKVAYYGAAGYDDVAAKTPLKKDGIFRMASQTKAIT